MMVCDVLKLSSLFLLHPLSNFQYNTTFWKPTMNPSSGKGDLAYRETSD